MSQYIILVLIALAGAGALIYALTQKHKPAPTIEIVPTPASGWAAAYGVKTPALLPQDANGDYYMDFANNAEFHYLVKAATGLQMGKTITMNFNVSGPGELKVADPNDAPPATVRLFIQGQTFNDRWWGDVVTNLTDGDHTVSVVVDPAHWTGVGGNPPVVQDPFSTVVANPKQVGFTCGGRSFAGHGVYQVGGGKRLTIKSYTIG